VVIFTNILVEVGPSEVVKQLILVLVMMDLYGSLDKIQKVGVATQFTNGNRRPKPKAYMLLQMS